LKDFEKVKILLTGSTGFVGSFFKKELSSSNIIATSKSGGKGVLPVDLTNKDELVSLFESVKPEVLIHIAGNKDVNFCEKFPKDARQINVTATQYLVELCKQYGTKFVYLSTDYVFDGKKGNYSEIDIPLPSSEYGKMKLESEKMIQSSGIEHIIIRSGALYGQNGKFYQWAVNSLKEGIEIEALTDSFFTPTLLDDLYEITVKLLILNFNGIIHIVGKDKVSRYQMISKIADSLDILFFLPDLSLCPDKLNKDLNIYTHTLEEGLKFLVSSFRI
jgi:dTDP-4-dehydrorhamnose reductase